MYLFTFTKFINLPTGMILNKKLKKLNIADGTGVIAVVPSKTYPKTGEDVTIKGHVKNALVVMAITLILFYTI